MNLEEGCAVVTKQSWGRTSEGVDVDLYTLQTSTLSVTLTSFGARVTSIVMKADDGTSTNVALGLNSVGAYERDTKTFMGATVGRFANRLALGQFSLDGVNYQVPANNAPNALHGGTIGFDQKVWEAREVEAGVAFSLVSPDGDMGFPGQLQATIRYTLRGSELRMDYTAETSRATVLNMTNHTYFNLAGEGAGPILDHLVWMDADRFTPVNGTLIPTGNLTNVAGTPFDFRQPAAIGERIDSQHEQLATAGGYDHNFVLNGTGFRKIATVVHSDSGRRLTVSTTEPGVQLYSGNFLDGSLAGASGRAYERRTGFCLETQHFPDSPNEAAFPSTRLDPGTTWRSTTCFQFDHVAR